MTAPLDLMTKFMSAILDKKYEEAYQLSFEVLKHEPHNIVVKQYQPLLEKVKDKSCIICKCTC